MQPFVTTTALFLDFSRDKLLGQYWPRLQRCVTSLTEEQLWWRPNDASNSVGNLLLHLNGNVTQWLIVPFAGGIDTRDRPAEFARREDAPGGELLARLAATMLRAEHVLGGLTEPDLLRTLEIQGYTVAGLTAVYQVVEHFGLHYGQISYITKQLRGKDLGFYAQLDRTGRVPGTPGSTPSFP
jgi:hypothetical protein